MICPRCGSRHTKVRTSGYFVIELLLWLLGFVFWPIFVFALVHSVWRVASRTRVCSSCGAAMVKVSSPYGRQLADYWSTAGWVVRSGVQPYGGPREYPGTVSGPVRGVR